MATDRGGGGRITDLEWFPALNDWWTRDRGRLAIVWGRRRVGKTMLLQRFARDKRAVFHAGAGRPLRDELGVLSASAAALRPGGTRDLLSRPFENWDDALDWLADRSADGPLLLVLDEFPELAGTAPELESILRAFSDRGARSGLRVLVCGSAVRTMRAMQADRGVWTHAIAPRDGCIASMAWRIIHVCTSATCDRSCARRCGAAR